MKSLIACFVLLSGVCFAQQASLSGIWTASGFLDVCSGPDDKLNKERMEALKRLPPTEFTNELLKAMDDRSREVAMCFGFLSGLEQGWKEGHEHGVIAAQVPEGWPSDEQKALATLPTKQIEAAHSAMTVDVPCVPDYVTLGQKRDIVVKYIQEQERKGNFLIPSAFTSRVVWLAFQEAFQCPARAAKPSNGAE
jgi:hypothetical protein